MQLQIKLVENNFEFDSGHDLILHKMLLLMSERKKVKLNGICNNELY